MWSCTALETLKLYLKECTEYFGKYVKSTQYKVDCLVYLCTSCNLKKDGRDAWVFDVDDTLLSTVPSYRDNLYGWAFLVENRGKKLNVTSLEEWMSKDNAPALAHSLKLFSELKSKGILIILIAARREHLRSATVDNLVKVGYYGWTSLIFRDPANELVSVENCKSDVGKQLMNDGYRIWGIVGDQYSSIEGIPSPRRASKLPNPMYYVA